MLDVCAVADSQRTDEDWDEIHGFASPGGFQRFNWWIAAAIDEGVLEEVEVGVPFGGSPMFDELVS
jgi:hypothetical protein